MIKPIRPILLTAAVFVLLYVAFQWAMEAAMHSRQVVMVPDLAGKSLGKAVDLLSAAKLGLLKESEQFDKRYPAGMVIRQNPSAGMMVREGRLVKVTVSQGGETVFVPEVIGKPLRVAEVDLRNGGLGLGEAARKPSLKFEKDAVIEQDPKPGSVVSKNTLVHLKVSDGLPPERVVLVPDFVGRDVAEAKAWAEKNRVSLAVQEQSQPNAPVGQILYQSLDPDTVWEPDSKLSLVVSGASGPVAGGPRILYEVPQGSTPRDIKILVLDESGERQVYRGSPLPGTRLEIPVRTRGTAKARVFVNGIMVEERDLR